MSKATMQDVRNVKAKVIQAALSLAAVKSWADLSFHAIARQADISVDDMRTLFDDKGAILSAYAADIDAQLEQSFSEGAGAFDESERDRLFDVLMERFDLLNDNRDAVKSILNTVTLDPKLMVISLPHVCKSMSRMLACANIPANGVKGALKVAGLTALYIKVLRDWINDESVDMAATMASLDKALSYFEKI